ncbi:MAG: formylglycine-generating enzyme family protein, partial [Anaerolineae bacterium]|nr:formylglycine-generating enzyme family protein [Anaerolineae bacterium]
YIPSASNNPSTPNKPTPPPDTDPTRLLRELDDIKITHSRRLDIGQRLAQIGDPRAGIGVLPNGIPDISWCFVEKGGEITIEKTKFTIKPFYVAKYLTTNAQYGAFVDAPDGYKNPEWWKLFPKEYRLQQLAEPRNPNSNAPRDRLSWYQSMAFAMWLDHQYRQNGLFQSVLNLNPADWKISLPPEWYWQWMAQKREFAWGKWDNAPRANTTEAGINDQSTAVGMYPHGVAECGAFDVTGNLWEWCLNDYSTIQTVNGYSNNETKVLRGGSFLSSRNIARVALRYYLSPYYVDSSYGCRVVLLPIVS